MAAFAGGGGRNNQTMPRSGFADLPLHGGRVPAWLAGRMARLGEAVVEHILAGYGPSGLLTRLSDPFWFQALGCVLGMDWHSSGITTAVVGALKRAIQPRAAEFGLTICGGRGRHSRRTPDELRAYAAAAGGLDGNALARASRLTARIDNNAVADGFQLYLHAFAISAAGEWAVVQQGMNAGTGMARRYHWHSATAGDFTADPHTAIHGRPQGVILNLVDARAGRAQQAMLELAGQPVLKTLGEARRLAMPRRHEVRAQDLDLKRLGAVLAVAQERELRDFANLLLVEGLGPRTLQALALVAEVVHGAPARFHDPARFAFAHGGKDGHPFPVPLKTYDETIAVLRRGLDAGRVERSEKLDAFCRLDRLARAVERGLEPAADFPAVIARERELSPSLQGRTVFGSARRRRAGAQLRLFNLSRRD